MATPMASSWPMNLTMGSSSYRSSKSPTATTMVAPPMMPHTGLSTLTKTITETIHAR